MLCEIIALCTIIVSFIFNFGKWHRIMLHLCLEWLKFQFSTYRQERNAGPSTIRLPLDSSFPRETGPRSTAPLEGEESRRRKDNKKNQLEESQASGLTSTHGHSSNSDFCVYVSPLIVNLSLLFSRVLVNFRHISFWTRNCTFSNVSHVLLYRYRLPSRSETFFSCT